jgi:hypothetical protein
MAKPKPLESFVWRWSPAFDKQTAQRKAQFQGAIAQKVQSQHSKVQDNAQATTTQSVSTMATPKWKQEEATQLKHGFDAQRPQREVSELSFANLTDVSSVKVSKFDHFWKILTLKNSAVVGANPVHSQGPSTVQFVGFGLMWLQIRLKSL